jgi:hypothetical protein
MIVKHIYISLHFVILLSAYCAVEYGPYLSFLHVASAGANGSAGLIVKTPLLSFPQVHFGLAALRALGTVGFGLGFWATHEHMYHYRIGYMYEHCKTSNTH